MNFVVYVIRSESTGKIYIGQTIDINKRLLRHNKVLKTKNKSYTSKNKGPWILIYTEPFNSRSEAIKKEKLYKSHQGRNWLRAKFNLGP